MYNLHTNLLKAIDQIFGNQHLPLLNNSTEAGFFKISSNFLSPAPMCQQKLTVPLQILNDQVRVSTTSGDRIGVSGPNYDQSNF